MPFNQRFSTIDKAVLTATGNSLVICGSTTALESNTSDMITPSGTSTRDWTKAGSSANLSILDNSTILYAELIWYSTVKSSDATALDVRSIADNPINFITPKGTVTVSPQNTEISNGASGSIDRFRSADVTSIIKNSLGGSYTVTNVPTSIPPTGLSNTRAGWTLTVAYKNNAFKPKQIGIYSGMEVATENSPIQAMLTGFSTEGDEASLRGSIFINAVNGDPLHGVQTLKVGSSFAKLINIGNIVGTPNPNPGTSPNNPWNSFFTGQINICDPLNSNAGLIDITGTNGSKNHDAFVPTQVLGARNKWDITNLDISNTLVPNQTLLAGQCTASGSIDGIALIAIGTEVNSLAPDITATLSSYEAGGSDVTHVEVGEELIYMVSVSNKGKQTANNLTLSMQIDPCCSFVSNSLKINGVVQTGADITKGANTGSISPDGVTTILFSVRINSMPATNPMSCMVNYSYDFQSGAGSPTYINYATTNSITNYVRSAQLTVVKSVSSTTCSVGDTLVYTIDVTNTGSEMATNILFQDLISIYCSFVSSSVSINGTVNPALDPNAGFSLSDLPSKGTAEIKFSVKVNTLPPSTKIDNRALVTFSYLFSDYTISLIKTIYSNEPLIQVQYVDIIGSRTNDNNYPNTGEVVTYTLTLNNVGNITAYNVQVQEPSIAGASFVAGSVTINGIKKISLNPFDGFTIDSIQPQTAAVVTYKVQVNQIQPGELIENIAAVPFKYQITPGGPVISTEKDSNKVTTRSNFVKITIPESVDKPYATVGDYLYYSINLTNTGNIDATNTIFLSHIQQEAAFVKDSVAINGLYYPGYDPNLGFSVGNISPNNTVTVTFKVKVNSVPNPNVIYNNSELIYSYLPDPNGNHITATAISNTVQTIINEASFTITKYVDKAYAQIGDILVYRTIISNTGTIPLNNVTFGDTISDYLKLAPGYVYINSVQYPDYDPNKGFPLGNINPKENFEIIFVANVIIAPPFGYVTNTSKMIYSYQVNPNTPIITNTKDSNEVATQIVNGSLSVTKTASKAYATVGDTINYSFNIANNGNVTVNNVNFIDYIPSPTNFISGSVIVNGISKPTFNPTTGFSLGSLTVGQVVTLNFNVTVNTVPTPNTIVNSGIVSFNYYLDPTAQPLSKTITSNNAVTVINTASAALTKQVDKSYATIQDTLNYTITASNTGTVTLKNVNFIDTILSGATFVPGSVIIDGTNYPNYNPNTGFVLDDITAGSSSIISFKVTVSSVPVPPVIKNSASINYVYRVNPTGSDISGSQTSNTVTTNINQASITNTKTVDKQYATISDTLTYNSLITNVGNIDVTNTNFIDTIPANTAFVAGSVKINGQSQPSYDPSVGFTLGTIAAAKSATVSFQVTVASVPQDGYVANTSNIYYQYKVDPNGAYASGNSLSNTVKTFINLGSMTLTKAVDRTYARLTDVLNYSFVITNTGNTILKSISFRDAIQVESSFNSGTVVINGVTKPALNPNNGFALEDIPVGSFTTITFKVTVNSIPASGLLYNTGTVNYSYYVDPNGLPVAKTITSNQTVVTVNDTIVSATKAVDKATAKINDTLTFTVTLTNAGNSPAQSVLFEDTLDSNIKFNAGSVYVNGTNNPSADPNAGFTLPDIAANTTTTVTFTAIVKTRPSDNIVRNYAAINYEYKVDPGKPFIPVSLTTNTTTTYIAVGELTLTKAVNKAYAGVKEVLTYTINVKNTGSVNATSLIFNDAAPTSTSFKAGTVYINGVNQPTLDPTVGFNMADLIPNQVAVVSFDVSVDSLPASGKVTNAANVTFNYKLTPSDPTVTKVDTSNTVTTNINLGLLNLTKTVDKSYVTILDTLNYTVTIMNAGNTDCLNIFFQDIIQAEASLVSGSVKINGVSKPSLDPNTGFNLDTISAGNTTTVSFAVTVNSLPTNSMVYNTSKATYNYYIDPNNTPIPTNSTSDTVATQINVGKLNVVKAVSKSYATISDVVTYTITVTNVGNVNATTVNFRDVVPTGLTFVSDSVKINGVSKPGYNPYSSFTLGTIFAGDSVIVKFDTIVTSVPSPSLVSNTAQITFAYRINPQGPDIVLEADSNAVTTQINKGELTLTKQVDKGYATIGDIITYSIILSNTGNVDTTNVIFIDNLQAEVSFNKGSLTVNGQNKPDADPTLGVNIGGLTTLSQATVSFKVTVTALPAQSSVLNVGTSNFSYKIDPTDGIFTKSAQSNPVYTIIFVPGMTAVKVVDLAYATISDILNYTVTVTNTGNNVNTKLFFVDTLSNGASFVAGSVIINGVSEPTYNPTTGFSLADMAAGASTIIQFQAKVTSLPTPSQVTNYAVINGVYKIDPLGPDYQISATTNTVSTQINVGSISDVKSVDKAYAKVGDTVTYTNVITNVGNVNATNVQFFDTLQAEATFIAGTVRINGVTNPNLNPSSGFALGDFTPNQTITVVFDAKINVLPTPPQVSNKSQMEFSYKIDPNASIITKTIFSNTVTSQVVKAELSMNKQVDKSIATVGDTLIFSINVTNIGNVIASNALFQDVPSEGVTFKAGSVMVNNVSQPTFDPTAGFSLGDIGIGNAVTVQFAVTVTSVPATNKVTNQAVINYKFTVDPKQPPISTTNYSNITTTNIALGNLSVVKSVDKQFATIGEKLTYTITITNSGNIDATNVVFLDPTPQNSTFVLGSVTVNGVSQPNYNPSAGFALNTMKPGEIVTVVYQVQVVS